MIKCGNIGKASHKTFIKGSFSGNCLKPLIKKSSGAKNAKVRHQNLCVKHGFYAEIDLKQKGDIGLNSI